MSVSQEVLVADFATETAVHLEELEPLLINAEGQTFSPEAVAASLRCFHSIKGLSRVLGIKALEKVAHEAETLLARIRSREMKFSSQVLDALLLALDAIRNLRSRFLVGEQALDIPLNVMDQLASCVLDAGLNASLSTTESAPQRQSSETELHGDAETLAAYMELLSETLSELAPWIDPAAPGEEHAQAHDTADMLQGASQKMGLGALEEAFGALLAAPPSRAIEKGIQISRVLVLVARLEKVLKAEAGVAELTAKTESALDAWLRTEAAALARFLADYPAGLEPARYSALRMHLLSQALGLQSAAAGLIRSAVVVWSDACSRQQSDALRALVSVLADGDPTNKVQDLSANLANLLAGPGNAAKAGADRRIDGARLALLTPENRVHMSSLGRQGSGDLFEVILDRQSSIRTLLVLGERLNQLGHLMLGQPLNIDGRASVALMLLAETDEDSLAKEIAAATGSGVPTVIRKLDGSILSRAFGPPLRADSTEVGDTGVRVPTKTLDRLFGRIGEFFQIGSQLNALVFDEEDNASFRRMADHIVKHVPELSADCIRIDRHFRELSDIEAGVQRTINLIHDSTLGLRVIPFDNLFGRFARLTHDMSRAQEKMVRFEGLAKGISIDKGMSELLADPLMHMIRNSIDHGIETPEERRKAGKEQTATLRITGSQTGNRILVEVADDGRGIDPNKVLRRAIANGLVRESEAAGLTKEQIYRLILLPGFSTVDEVTETSGRGVGMDVVLVNVTRMAGRLSIHSTPGQGTRFVIELPLSAVVQSVLLVEAGRQTLAFPEQMVVEAKHMPRDLVQTVNGQSAVLWQDRYLPVFDLMRLLRLPEDPTESREMVLLTLEHYRHRVGVVVRRVLRRHDMLIRESHPRLAALPGVGGVSVLGNDRVVLVIDPQGLFDLASRSPGATLYAAVAP